ncbi:MAG TPA: hypothetical protein VLV49_10620 [Terriglobales bacterium]|nr:hypothetical protein [Terriglobales bacterium]
MPYSATDLPAPSGLEAAIGELQGAHALLLSGDVDPRILSDFRDALNRVRNTAWAAQQYVTRKEVGEDSSSVLSLLAAERIRAAHQLCRTISEDLKEPSIEFQTGNLVHLNEILQELAEQIREIIKKRK